MAIYKFRSRYSDKDTSYLLPENQPKIPSSWWWVCLSGTYNTTCSSRTRSFISIIVLLILTTTLKNASSIFSFVENQSQTLAHRQSFGYVDVPKWKWKSQQLHYKSIHTKPIPTEVPPAEKVVEWYDSNVLVDFVCPNEHLIGDVWWLCNPKHINSIPGCTIYSSGPALQLTTEFALAELLPSCDIHVFDPINTTDYDFLLSGRNYNIQVHPWGFAERAQTVTNTANNSTLQLKTLKETQADLGHPNVHLLLLQCGGCEWKLDYGGIPQVLVRVNGIQNAKWFKEQWKQYVLFHKQPVALGGILGRGQLLSYLKLRNAFFA